MAGLSEGATDHESSSQVAGTNRSIHEVVAALNNRVLIVVLAIGAGGCSSGHSSATAVPATPRHAVTDEYHGVRVVDDYRWLENGEDSEVQRWSREENRYTRAALDTISSRPRILQRLEDITRSASANYFALQYRGGALFALKTQPPAQHPYLVTMAPPDDLQSERVVVNPNALDRGGTTTIDFYVPSLNGRLVAVSLSRNGTEEGTLHLYETATGRSLVDTIAHVNDATAGGSVAWNAAGTGFYYTRYPRIGERSSGDRQFYQQIYFHQLGTPSERDRYEIGREFPRIAYATLQSDHEGYVLATVGRGFGGESAHYLRDPSGAWISVTNFGDGASRAALGPDGALYLLSHQNAPRGTILRLSLKDPEIARASTVVKESAVTIEDFVPTATRLYVRDGVGGPSQLRIFDHEGRLRGSVPVKPVSTVRSLVAVRGDDILFLDESFVDPPAWYRFDPQSGKAVRTAMFLSSPAAFDDVDVIRDSARSNDGTSIPLTIICRRGTPLNGQNPTLLTGYGGMGISLSPSFNAARRVWLDAGGVYASANLRGGGEFGEGWHRAGNLTSKQNVFDDFEASARRLIELGYTTAPHLAIEGASNGGLLMGAVLTQHPELFRAVVSHVGIYDMLRFEKEPNGAFGIPEYGTVEDPQQFKALYAYSPYHHVVDGVGYPAVLLTTDANDGRVSPANSRKMAARLQAATSSDRPVLLWTSMGGGHGGAGLSTRLSQQADVFAFLIDQLGVGYQR